MGPKLLLSDARKAGALAAVGTAVLVAGGLIAALTHGSTRLASLGLAVVGVAILGLRVLQWRQIAAADRVARQRDDQAARLGLRGPVVKVSEFSVEDAGSDRLQAPVPYIPRAAEQELMRHLEEAKADALAREGRRLIVVAGASKAGKTRLLLEVAQRVLPEWVVIRPTPAGMAECLRAEGVPSGLNLDRVVIWLDDLEPFAQLGPSGLNAGTLAAYLDEFAEAPGCSVVILATRGGRGRETLDHTDEPSRFMSALAELEPLSRVVELDERLNDAELDGAAKILTPLRMWDRDQVERHGLGAYLVGGPTLMTTLLTGRRPGGLTNRAGQHVAWLVAWWAYLGMVEPVTRAQLAAMWRAFPDPESGAADSALSAALAWACVPLVPSRPAVALVCGSDDDGYWPYDYVRARMPEAGDPPFDTDGLTATVFDLIGPEQLFGIGWVAYDRADLALAERAWTTLLGRNDAGPEIGPRTAYGLGLILKQRGEADRAIRMFELVVRSQDPDAAPRARKSIGTVLWERDELDRAAQHFLELTTSGHPEAAPSAAYDLALLLERTGDAKGAEEWYRTAISMKHPRISASAAVNLGRLIWDEGRGDLEAAIGCFEAAIAFGDQEQTAKAYMNTATARLDLGDTAGAETALERAFAQHHHELSPVAGFRLGQLRRARGDVDGAANAFREAAAYAATDGGWQARLALAALLEESGDVTGAQSEYEVVLGSGRAEPVAAAGVSLGALCVAQGDRDGAKSAYQQAADSGVSPTSEHAACRMAILLEEDGDIVAARASFEQALTSEDQDLAAYAANRLGELAEKDGDLIRAAMHFQRASNSSDTKLAALANARVGNVLQRAGDEEGAIAAFRTAADSGLDDIASAASLILGSLLSAAGDKESARVALDQAVKTGGPKVRQKACELLSDLG